MRYFAVYYQIAHSGFPHLSAPVYVHTIMFETPCQFAGQRPTLTMFQPRATIQVASQKLAPLLYLESSSFAVPRTFDPQASFHYVIYTILERKTLHSCNIWFVQNKHARTTTCHCNV